MKKSVQIIGFVAIATSLFLTKNQLKTNNIDLASLITMNTANAEIDPDGEVEDIVDCSHTEYIDGYTVEVSCSHIDCISGEGTCTPEPCYCL